MGTVRQYIVWEQLGQLVTACKKCKVGLVAFIIIITCIYFRFEDLNKEHLSTK